MVISFSVRRIVSYEERLDTVLCWPVVQTHSPVIFATYVVSSTLITEKGKQKDDVCKRALIIELYRPV